MRNKNGIGFLVIPNDDKGRDFVKNNPYPVSFQDTVICIGGLNINDWSTLLHKAWKENITPTGYFK